MRKQNFSEEERKKELKVLDNQIDCYDKNIGHHRDMFLYYLFPFILSILGFLYELSGILDDLSQPSVIIVIIFGATTYFLISRLHAELRRLEKLRRIRNEIHMMKELLINDVIDDKTLSEGMFMSKLIEWEHKK